MAGALGTVTVELSANIAKFETALTKSAAIAEARAKEIDKSLSIVKTSLSVLGVGFLANQTFDKIKEKITGAIESAAGLKELSEKTGVAASQLSGLASVAKLSGTDTESLGTGLQKLSKSMVDAASGGTKTTAALNSIGISAQGIDKLKPDQAFLKIALQLDKYADGANKTAIAQALFGKAGANLLPVLKDLAIAGDIQVKTTDEQAAAAQAYERGLRALQLSTNAVYKTIALEAVPAMSEFVQVLLGAQRETGGLNDQVKKLAKDGSMREFFEGAAIYAAKFVDVLSSVKKEISIVIAGVKLAASVPVIGGLRFGKKDDLDKSDAANGVPAKIAERARLAKEFENAQNDFLNNSTKFEDAVKTRFAAARNAGAKAEGARPDAKFSDALRKAGKAGSTDDPDSAILAGKLKAQEAFIARAKHLAAGYISDLDFEAHEQYITQVESLDVKKKVLEDELKAITQAHNKELKATDQYLALGKKDSKSVAAQATRQGILDKQVAAEDDARQKIAKVLQERGAIQREFDLGTKDVARQASLSNADAQFQINLLGKSTLEVQKLSAARQIQLALEERIRLERLKDKDADVSKAVTDAAEQQERAGKLIEESYAKQRSGAFGASEALRKYGEDATNTGAQIESSLTNAFKGAEDALVSFATTGKLNFAGLAQSIIADLARIQAKAAISGILKYLGGAVGDFFGGGAGLGSDPTGSQFSQTGADVAGRRATGGPVGAGGRYLVGENGPEILTMGGSGGSIIPNGAMGGGGQVNVTINATTGQSSSSANDSSENLRALGKTIAEKVREIIVQEKRNGGMLA